MRPLLVSLLILASLGTSACDEDLTLGTNNDGRDKTEKISIDSKSSDEVIKFTKPEPEPTPKSKPELEPEPKPQPKSVPKLKTKQSKPQPKSGTKLKTKPKAQPKTQPKQKKKLPQPESKSDPIPESDPDKLHPINELEPPVPEIDPIVSNIGNDLDDIKIPEPEPSTLTEKPTDWHQLRRDYGERYDNSTDFELTIDAIYHECKVLYLCYFDLWCYNYSHNRFKLRARVRSADTVYDHTISNVIGQTKTASGTPFDPTSSRHSDDQWLKYLTETLGPEQTLWETLEFYIKLQAGGRFIAKIVGTVDGIPDTCIAKVYLTSTIRPQYIPFEGIDSTKDPEPEKGPDKNMISILPDNEGIEVTIKPKGMLMVPFTVTKAHQASEWRMYDPLTDVDISMTDVQLSPTFRVIKSDIFNSSDQTFSIGSSRGKMGWRALILVNTSDRGQGFKLTRRFFDETRNLLALEDMTANFPDLLPDDVREYLSLKDTKNIWTLVSFGSYNSGCSTFDDSADYAFFTAIQDRLNVPDLQEAFRIPEFLKASMTPQEVCINGDIGSAILASIAGFPFGGPWGSFIADASLEAIKLENVDNLLLTAEKAYILTGDPRILEDIEGLKNDRWWSRVGLVLSVVPLDDITKSLKILKPDIPQVLSKHIPIDKALTKLNKTWLNQLIGPFAKYSKTAPSKVIPFGDKTKVTDFFDSLAKNNSVTFFNIKHQRRYDGMIRGLMDEIAAKANEMKSYQTHFKHIMNENSERLRVISGGAELVYIKAANGEYLYRKIGLAIKHEEVGGKRIVTGLRIYPFGTKMKETIPDWSSWSKTGTISGTELDGIFRLPDGTTFVWHHDHLSEYLLTDTQKLDHFTDEVLKTNAAGFGREDYTKVLRQFHPELGDLQTASWGIKSLSDNPGEAFIHISK